MVQASAPVAVRVSHEESRPYNQTSVHNTDMQDLSLVEAAILEGLHGQEQTAITTTTTHGMQPCLPHERKLSTATLVLPEGYIQLHDRAEWPELAPTAFD